MNDDPDDTKLKAEIDEITISVKNIMKRVEEVMPEKKEDTPGENGKENAANDVLQ